MSNNLPTAPATSTTVTDGVLELMLNSSKQARSIGINSLCLDTNSLRVDSFHKNTFIHIDIETLRSSEENPFPVSIAATEENEQLLATIRRGNPDVTITEMPNLYLFDNGHRKVGIRRVNPTLSDTAINNFLASGKKFGPKNPISFSGKAALSLTGKEPKVLLGMYADKLESLLTPGHVEHFFREGKDRQIMRSARILLKSYSFLKFGYPEFKVSLHHIEGKYWLLTKSEFTENINIQVLEKLTVIR